MSLTEGKQLEILSIRNMARSALNTGNEYHIEASLRGIDKLYNILQDLLKENKHLKQGFEHLLEEIAIAEGYYTMDEVVKIALEALNSCD